MTKRYLAHYFRSGSDETTLAADSLDELKPFISSCMQAVQESHGGRTLCVADLRSRSEHPWIWRMQAGGAIDGNPRVQSSRQALAVFG